ncbi:MAG: type II and III secretion system protein [Bacteroidales bacterium]|nr:type II and III secretion system protein [Bacteroidales bacterium]
MRQGFGIRLRWFVYLLLGLFLFSSLDMNAGQVAPDSLETSVQFDSLSLEQKIHKLSGRIEALNKTIDISVTNVSIHEFVRAVGNLSGVNINIAPDLQITVVNNFTEVKVADLIYFLCKQYRLDIEAVGSIIDLYRPKPPEMPLVGVVKHNTQANTLDLDFKNIPLSVAVRQITQEAGINVFAHPDIQNTFVNILVTNLKPKNAIEHLAKANNLDFEENEDGSFYIKAMPDRSSTLEAQQKGSNVYNPSRNQSYGSQGQTSQRNLARQPAQSGGSDTFVLEVTPVADKRISIVAIDAPMSEVIKEASRNLDANYFLGIDLKDNISLSLQNVTYEDLLRGMFIGREIAFVKDEDTYIIGDKKLDSFKVNKIIGFTNRPVDSLLVQIPEEMIVGLTIKEFPDLNSLLVSGSQERVLAFQNLCEQIDKVVPVIMIEIIIVDVKTSTTLDTGIEAGLGEGNTKTTGSVYPSVDLSLSTGSINNLIRKINGTGMANLGKVSGDFYLNIKALEASGNLKIRSTPILSTLNGYEAKINIGKTEYYLLEQSNVTAGQTPVLSTTREYPSVEAKLEVIIKPFVSGDDQITLNVKVLQSDFTERIDKNAPPGKVSRDFSSKIRVKNQEMILLGGLEEISTRESSSGIPFLQRIPIIKWFFSSRSKQDSNSKLNIFIRPTIIG